MSKKITALIPGAALALGIACIAKWLETLESSAGLHLIGASVIALFIGMAINAFFQPNKTTAPGIKFTSKKVLKFAIVLLGASLNIRTVLTVGRFSLTVMLFTLATCFGLGALIGKALGLNWKTSSLINAGTGICGGSAIAAIAPVIEADDMDIAAFHIALARHLPARHAEFFINGKDLAQLAARQHLAFVVDHHHLGALARLAHGVQLDGTHFLRGA